MSANPRERGAASPQLSLLRVFGPRPDDVLTVRLVDVPVGLAVLDAREDANEKRCPAARQLTGELVKQPAPHCCQANDNDHRVDFEAQSHRIPANKQWRGACKADPEKPPQLR